MVFQYGLIANNSMLESPACDSDGASWYLGDPSELHLYVNRYIHYIAEATYTDTTRWAKVNDPITNVQN